MGWRAGVGLQVLQQFAAINTVMCAGSLLHPALACDCQQPPFCKFGVLLDSLRAQRKACAIP